MAKLTLNSARKLPYPIAAIYRPINGNYCTGLLLQVPTSLPAQNIGKRASSRVSRETIGTKRSTA